MTDGMYLTQGLHRSLRATGHDAMTVCGERVRTFAEVADRVSRLAGAFRSLGARDGDRIAILSLNSDRYQEYLLATPWAGAVVNPINIRWSAAEIAYSLRDSDTRILLIDDTFLPLLPELRSQFRDLATVIHCGDGPAPDGTLGYEDLVRAGEPVPDAHRSGSDLAGIFYTGGTSGHPKGVMLTHDNLMTSAMGGLASGFFLTSGGPLLHAAPMFHLADLAIWLEQVIRGGTHVFIPSFKPEWVLDAVHRHRISDLLLVPTMVQMLVDHPSLPDHDTSSVQAVLYGGSPISAALLERAAVRIPTASFVQAYGMTEVSPIATLLGPQDHHDPVLRRSGGKAAPHSEVRIVVGDDDTELPRGEVGEITVRGGHVMAGYWGKPEETAAALRDGWMHTGDAGYMDDRGYVFVVDRLKDMIVSGGENVYSVEVENALARHPAVATCAVIGVPDERWGERVHAVVVLASRQPGPNQDLADELREFCKTLIGSYKIPRSFEVVDELPLSAAGKVLKRELRAKYWTGSDRSVG